MYSTRKSIAHEFALCHFFSGRNCKLRFNMDVTQPKRALADSPMQNSDANQAPLSSLKQPSTREPSTGLQAPEGAVQAPDFQLQDDPYLLAQNERVRVVNLNSVARGEHGTIRVSALCICICFSLCFRCFGRLIVQSGMASNWTNL